MEKNLFLIGYRGTGKTTIGRVVARKLNKKFIDTDELIVTISGKKIPQIFEEKGEEKFREFETIALKQASEMDDVVISCGGGIIVKERNFEFLKKGVVCLLTASEDVIYGRIYGDQNRPSLTDKDPREEITHVLSIRNPLYKKASDFEINTDKIGKEQHANSIIKKYLELLK